MANGRMKRMKVSSTAHAAKLRYVDPNKPPYERTWDDEHKPQVTMGIAMLAAANVAKFYKIDLEAAKARIYEDFDVQKMTVRVRPSTMAKAAWAADHTEMAGSLRAAREAKE